MGLLQRAITFVLATVGALWASTLVLVARLSAMPTKNTSLLVVVHSLLSVGTALVPVPVQSILSVSWLALSSTFALFTSLVRASPLGLLSRLGYWVLTRALGRAFKSEVQPLLVAISWTAQWLDNNVWARLLDASLPPLLDGHYPQEHIDEAASVPIVPAPSVASYTYTRQPSPTRRDRIALGLNRDGAVLRWRAHSERFEAWAHPAYPGPTAYLSIVVPGPHTGADRTARPRTRHALATTHLGGSIEEDLPGVPMTRTPASSGRPRTPGTRWSEHDMQAALSGGRATAG